jgi:hypothetical protein
MKKISFDTILKLLTLIVLGAILVVLLQNNFTRSNLQDKQTQDPLSLPFIKEFISQNPRGVITQYTNNGENLYILNSFALSDGFSIKDDEGKTLTDCSVRPQAFNRPLCTRIKSWDSKIIYDGQKIKKDIPEIANGEEINTVKIFLKSLFTTHPNLFAIRECTYQNNTYFSVQPEGTGDAGFVIYDSKGTIYARGGGFSGTGSSKEFLMVSPTCTKLIYRKTYNLSNQNPDIIDIYHLNP